MRINIGGIYYNIQADDGYFVIKEQPLKEDSLSYTIDEENLTMTVKIVNPSERTLYNISLGRLYMCLDAYSTSRRISSPSYHQPVRTNFHPRWGAIVPLNGLSSGQIQKINNVDLEYTISINPIFLSYRRSYLWFHELAKKYHNPSRSKWFFQIRPILFVNCGEGNGMDFSKFRFYAPGRATSITLDNDIVFPED